MKIKDDFILREIDDEYVIIPIGDETLPFHGLMTINEIGAFLWEQLTHDTTIDALLQSVLDTYEVDEETARKDIIAFIEKLESYQVIEHV